MNAIAADPMEPAMFKKSVKFGISKDMPVINHTIRDLAITFLTLLRCLLPQAKNRCVSYISKAAKICTGYEQSALKQVHTLIKIVKGYIGKLRVNISYVYSL